MNRKVSLSDLLCAECQVRFRGICSSLNLNQLNEIASITKHVHYKKGNQIISLNEEADKIYNIVNGSIRQYKILPDGRRQIVGFLFAGDFLGIPYEKNFSFYADAIEESCLCVFSRNDFEMFLKKFPSFKSQVLKKISLKLSNSFEHNLLLGKKDAKEKLATFLILISKIQEIREKTNSHFNIPMTRDDISDYLGLRTETTSRIFSTFTKDGLIQFIDRTNSNFLIKNFKSLEKIGKVETE